MIHCNDKTESNIRLAESLIQKAKELMQDEYDKYEDVQHWMNHMELMRQETVILLSKYLNKKMK